MVTTQMITRFIIVKSSRNIWTANLDMAYSGPSCEMANVPFGKIYYSKEEAEADAKKLSAVNPVGFVVVKV